jgi:hypothetical protein
MMPMVLSPLLATSSQPFVSAARAKAGAMTKNASNTPSAAPIRLRGERSCMAGVCISFGRMMLGIPGQVKRGDTAS